MSTFAAIMTEQEKRQEIKWYVVGTTSSQHEIKIRNAIRKAGMECYVPLKYGIKNLRGKQERRMQPAITGLIFAKTSYNQFMEYAITSKDRVYLRKSAYSNKEEYLTISDTDMERFMDLSKAFQEHISYLKPEEVTLHEGELVQIKLGTKTYEAEIKRINGKREKQLVVEIPSLAIAAITLTPELMKTITRLSGKQQEENRQRKEASRQRSLQEKGQKDMRKIRNFETDKKQLMEIACRLLFEITPEHQEDPENEMALLDMKRIRERLVGRRGVIAAQEGELALAMYLASVKLELDVEKATERLKLAISKLKDSSMLKMRMRYYLARVTNDEIVLREIRDITKGWNRLRLSPRQQGFLKEIE